MPGGIKISKPERLPKDNVSETDLHAWWNEIKNYLNQDDDFHLFKTGGAYSTWKPGEENEDRITEPVGRDNNADLIKRQRQLNNFLTVIAGCCSRDHYMHIIKQATSLNWIWTELQIAYQHQHKGKNFLNITDIQWNPQDSSPMSLYTNYRAKILENLKPQGTVLQWKNDETMGKSEVMTPTFEDHILLTVINLINPKLPAKVKEVFGPRLEKGKFLMDLKNDILANVNKMLEDLDNEDIKINAAYPHQEHDPYQMAYMRGSFRGRGRGRGNGNRPNRGQGNNRGGNKFCRLCHLARQERQITLSHEIGDLTCPSLSGRDKEGLKSKVYQNAALPEDQQEEDEDIDEIANNYGYSEYQVPKDKNKTNKTPETDHNTHTSIHLIKPVPSQILTVFQNEVPLHLDLDSGCWISTIKQDIAEKMKWKIHPNGQLAKIADGKTVLQSVGEIHETFYRNNWTVHFSAIVMKDLHTNIIAGNNFILDNKVKQDLSAKTITVHNKYVVPETNRHTELPQYPMNTIIHAPINTIILPKQSTDIRVPHNEGDVILVEPINNKDKWPTPQICTVDNNNTIEIQNHGNSICKVNKPPIALRVMAENQNLKKQPGYTYSKETPKKEGNIDQITKNENRLTDHQREQLQDILEKNRKVFDNDLSKGYNEKSGPHQCKLKFANQERPSSKKVHCPTYNTNLNVLLQQVCDELTDANVLGVPQHDNVNVNHVMPCFLRKKQKAKDKANKDLTPKDVRLVVNTCELSKYIKSLPAKVTKPQEVYNALAKWKYIIKTDLYQGFFQNHLHPSAQGWCCILTPFGGIRYFKRGIQGLINQSEELDEMLSNIFKQMLTEGKMVKIADDFFLGGQTIEETMKNFSEMLELSSQNNIKLSPAKTVMFPTSVDVLSWVWSEGGMLSPSPHRKQALMDTKQEDVITIKDLRSWIGLYKTFLYHTPNLTNILDPLDRIVGGKDSKDKITWTSDLTTAFNKAKSHAKDIQQVYLPHPNDQLIITTDGARNPPGVGFLMQAKDKNGTIKPVRYYSVKLKPHHMKWNPCEIEAVAFGTAIEAFYDIIKESNHPVVICPDSKPVCDAAKLLQQGKFSLSPRIQTFLNNMGKINTEIQHISGKSGQNQPADFQSRNTTTCHAEVCQICTYVNSNSDTIIHPKINPMISQEIPYANREGWKRLQDQDKACSQAKTTLTTGQLPSKKVGRVQSDTRKFASHAKVDDDGLLYVPRNIPYSSSKEQRIVIPTSYMQPLMNQLHMKHDHPTKSQLKSLFDKYFYGSGTSSFIDEIHNKCHICQAVKKLPQQQTFTTTTEANMPGTHFVADIMKRAKQNILVIRDQFSSYTTATTIMSEKHQDIEDAIIDLITPIRAPEKVTVKTDQATGFQYLNRHKAALSELDIYIELANDFSKNAVATVDKGMQELQQEIKKLQHSEKPLTKATLSMALMNLNSRLRRGGQISSREILFARDYNKKTNLNLNDHEIATEQRKNREKDNKSHNTKVKQINTDTLVEGDRVMLRQNPTKHKIRDTFVVKSTDNKQISIQKVINPISEDNRVRAKVYSVPTNKVFKTLNARPMDKILTTYQYKKFDPICRKIDSSDDSSYDSTDESDNDERPEQINYLQPNHANDQNLNDNNQESDDNNEPNGTNEQESDNNSDLHGTNEQDSNNDSDQDGINEPESDDLEDPDYIDQIEISSDSEYLSPSEEEIQPNITPEKQKTPIKETWITAKTPINQRNLHNKNLLKLKQNLAATKIQKWYKKRRMEKITQRKCKLAAKQLISIQLGRKPPETLRTEHQQNQYHISSEEEDRHSRYPSSTDDNILDTTDNSLEWDNHEQCMELSFNNAHNDAFLADQLNLSYELGMDMNKVYRFDKVLAEQHSPPCKLTPKTSTPCKQTVEQPKPKSKWKKFLFLKK